MGKILAVLGIVADFVQWLIGYGQRQIGRQQQREGDDKKTIAVQKAELKAAVNRPTDSQLSNELRHGRF